MPLGSEDAFMNRKLRMGILAACLAGLPALMFAPVDVAASHMVTANVPVNSMYYTYVEKLSGMGYIKSLPNGAKPYSRMLMAKWVKEAQDTAKTKPMPRYLQDDLQAMEKEFAPELATLNGTTTYSDLKLRSVTGTLAYQGGDNASYPYRRNINGSWQPFGSNRNGYAYGKDGNVIAEAELSGNIGHDVAIAITPRMSYDKDNHLSMSLEEGYIKTRTGMWAWEVGRQSMLWGQGATGTLALSNNMRPLTTVQTHFLEPQKVGGFLKFLGEADFHVFYGTLEGDRADMAADYGRKDYDNAGLLGLRLDITPTNYLTFGMERISMMGGTGNAMSLSDWGHWTYGHNDDNNADRWDDIAGVDFRLRFPGVQFYGEAYGEDQAGGWPSLWGYRGGVYLPQLSRDGLWDMTMEVANTQESWYSHGKFQNGWTYHGNIMGDAMGYDARKYYVGINRHFPKEAKMGLYAMRTEMDRCINQHPTVDEIELTGQRRIGSNMYLNGTLGFAKVKNANYTNGTDHDTFAQLSLKWIY